MPQSQNGFPVLSASQTKKWKIPGAGGRHLILAPGAPGFVLAHFAAWFDRRIEPLDQGQWDEWGWADRDIRGSTTISNHASGTAIDLNAMKHPMGKRDTFTPRQQRRIRRKLRRTYRGVIRWGGDYTGRPDDMHFEINASYKRVRRIRRRLRWTRSGRRLVRVNR